jgi:capsular exopolysaccharide synthesis family protein
MGLAFLIEYLDNSVRSEAELEKYFGRTVLGSIEKVDKKGSSIESYIVEQPMSPVAESYRLIRSGILLSSAEKPPCTIVITSMNPGEGKTATTINLARVLIQDQRSVVIVGCDLRRPRMHTLFGLENDVGLTSYLSGNVREVPLQDIADEGLKVITAGPMPPNPSELLSSNKMKELMDELAESYNFVLLDAPPVQSVTDALPLASNSDGTLVVVQYGKTTYDMMRGGMKKLNDVNAHVLGFVINGLKKSEAGSYYYGYSGYYKKYS